MTSTRSWYLLVCLTLCISGVGLPGERLVARAAEKVPAPPPGLAAPGQPTPMPEFSVPGLTGTPIRSADLRGKVVVVRFWATW
jgi:hypothetical protein